jgi:hypothetical protein
MDGRSVASQHGGSLVISALRIGEYEATGSIETTGGSLPVGHIAL